MSQQTLQVTCPGCGTRSAWRTDNPHRPFCSDSCKTADFIAWANEEQVISGQPVAVDSPLEWHSESPIEDQEHPPQPWSS